MIQKLQVIQSFCDFAHITYQVFVWILYNGKLKDCEICQVIQKKVTFLSSIVWRSLKQPSERGSRFHHPKKVTSRIVRYSTYYCVTTKGIQQIRQFGVFAFVQKQRHKHKLHQNVHRIFSPQCYMLLLNEDFTPREDARAWEGVHPTKNNASEKQKKTPKTTRWNSRWYLLAKMVVI